MIILKHTVSKTNVFCKQAHKKASGHLLEFGDRKKNTRMVFNHWIARRGSCTMRNQHPRDKSQHGSHNNAIGHFFYHEEVDYEQ